MDVVLVKFNNNAKSENDDDINKDDCFKIIQ